MWFIIIALAIVIYFALVVKISYQLGKTKTDNAKIAATIGGLLAFIPPLALIYLVVLALKPDVSIV